ncbi:2Fe-2S iron-sulfur cluster-binding protein [uncultured Alsobacter sp.]|uniref:2Fe-2S iron-sulfur cluster-binding protein n=1 Tax=uncultured Alsobacter sp. TaxID=1748258 RepID=UPI0025CD94EF|nr:2Fe-2S iron-sulfur cluster-binding protein [uncultured Alsobacter sp.]
MPVIIATDRAGKEHRIEGKSGQSVMLNLREVGGLDIAAICGGSCSCSTCHVYVDEDWMDKVPAQQPDEYEVVEFSSHYQPNSRLSCQIPFSEALDGLKVTLAPEG